MKSIKEPTGYILYEGKSLYKESDNDIVVILQTGNSANKKTGNMLQVWIMLKDIDPIEANKLGYDIAICGECPLKGIANNDPNRKEAINRTCYVNFQTVKTIYRSYKKGNYPKIDPVDASKMIKYNKIWCNRGLRFGAYGDPALIPTHVTHGLRSHLPKSMGITAYSHQANYKHANLDPCFMLSCETLDQAKTQWDKGNRTARTIKSVDELQENEMFCPATEQGGSRFQCFQCNLCNAERNKKNIAWLPHGKQHAINNLTLQLA